MSVSNTDTILYEYWHHNSVADGPIWMKFGRQMQNDMPMVMQTYKLEPEVEFQYGRLLFSETGSNNISAVHSDISLEFGMRVYFDLPI